jgi:hypothetical protein
MSSLKRMRSSQTLPIVLLGVSAFTLALFFTTLTRGPAVRVLAQTPCAQPSSAGCPMELDILAEAVISEPTAVHNWLLNVPLTNDITITLGSLAADYQLWIYGPDNSLLGISNNPGTASETINATNVGPGTYWVVVDSPSGAIAEQPYALFAVAPSVEPLPVPAPVFRVYEPTPGPRTFLPY